LGGGSVVFLSQAEEFALLPARAELVWGVLSILLLVVVVLALVWLVRTLLHHRGTVQSLQDRVASLEGERVEKDDST
jgi:membrane protein implicated in regulation of membrane protease activity